MAQQKQTFTSARVARNKMNKRSEKFKTVLSTVAFAGLFLLIGVAGQLSLSVNGA